VRSSDVKLLSPPLARPGKTTEFVVVLDPEFPATDADEISIAVLSVAANLQPVASLLPLSTVPPIHLAVRVGNMGIMPTAAYMRVDVPATAVTGDCLVLSSVRLAGTLVALHPPPELLTGSGGMECRVPITSGMIAPNALVAPAEMPSLSIRHATPAFGADGTLYVPRWNASRDITVFDADGFCCPSLTVVDMTTEALAYDEGSGMLFAGGGINAAGMITAVDMRSSPLLPRVCLTAEHANSRIVGVAVLPPQTLLPAFSEVLPPQTLLPASSEVLPPQTLLPASSESHGDPANLVPVPSPHASAVVVCAFSESRGDTMGCVRVFRASDGVELAALRVVKKPEYLATDPTTIHRLQKLPECSVHHGLGRQ
jgi:hypothetical protein